MISHKYALSLFDYRDGALYWRVRKSLKTSIGDSVGWFPGSGYGRVRIDGKGYYVHRIIFLYHHGRMPKEIDHIDGNKSNNKIENLRECTKSQNQYNRKLDASNTSGIKGVYWHINSKKWIARINNRGKHIYLGCFNDIEVAEQVVRIERLRLHGEFANHGY